MARASRPTVADARRLVRWASRMGVAAVHGEGNVWFRTNLVPALAIAGAAAKTRADRNLLSGEYYVVGASTISITLLGRRSPRIGPRCASIRTRLQAGGKSGACSRRWARR